MVNHGKRSDRDNAGDSLALIVDGDGKVTNRYLYGSLVDEVLAEETLAYDANNNVTSNVLWALSDHQGSVRDWAKIGTEVSVVKHVDYDPFGNVIDEYGNVIDTQATNAAIATMFGFTGRSTDPLTKLQDNRARPYDPTLGRFISQDPIGFAAGDANLYRYVGNKPSNATDPSGLDEVAEPSISKEEANRLRNNLLTYLNPISRGASNFFGAGYSSMLLRHYLDGSGKEVTIGCGLIESHDSFKRIVELSLLTLLNGPIDGKTKLTDDGRSNVNPFTFIGGDPATAIAGTHGVYGKHIKGGYRQQGFHGIFEGEIEIDVHDVYDFHPGGKNLPLPGFGNVKDADLCAIEQHGLAKRFDVHVRVRVRVRAVFDNAGEKIMSLKIIRTED